MTSVWKDSVKIKSRADKSIECKGLVPFFSFNNFELKQIGNFKDLISSIIQTKGIKIESCIFEISLLNVK